MLMTPVLASMAWQLQAPLNSGSTPHIACLRARRSPTLSFTDCELARNGLAAFAASATATCLLHPLDTLKTRYQGEECASEECVVEASGLWRGLPANVLKEAPDAAIFLALSEELSRSLSLSSPWFASHMTARLLLSGAVGDACGSVLRLPAEVICKRLQSGTSADTALGWQRALADTSRESWMTSWTAIVARDVPFGALQIAVFEEERHAVHEARSSFASALWPPPLLQGAAAAATAADAGGSSLLPLPAGDGLDLGAVGADLASMISAESLSDASAMVPDSLSDLLAGILAGAIAGALTTPLDVLVTHVSTVPAVEEGQAPSVRRGALARGIELVREHGPLTLTRGLGYRTLYYAPLIGCFFGLYEYFRRLLE